MSAATRPSRRDRRRAMRAATRRRVRGGENRAPVRVQRMARQVDDMAFATTGRLRRALAGDRPFVLGLLALVLVGVMVVSGPLRSYLDQHDRVELLERQLAALQDANADLAERAEDLRDPAHLRLLARQQYGYIRPGEVPYVVVPPQTDTSEISDEPTVDEPADRSWYETIWDGLAGLFG